MRRKYSVPAGIVLLIASTFFCISYIPFKRGPQISIAEKGKYDLSVNGDRPFNLTGSATFLTPNPVLTNSSNIGGLRLILSGGDAIDKNNLDFFITGPEIDFPLARGKYSITEEFEGFIKGFQGVFGFADINTLGELPYFTEKGHITIVQSDNDEVEGTIELSLRNGLGEIIELEGQFSAISP